MVDHHRRFQFAPFRKLLKNPLATCYRLIRDIADITYIVMRDILGLFGVRNHRLTDIPDAYSFRQAILGTAAKNDIAASAIDAFFCEKLFVNIDPQIPNQPTCRPGRPGCLEPGDLTAGESSGRRVQVAVCINVDGSDPKM